MIKDDLTVTITSKGSKLSKSFQVKKSAKAPH